MFCLVEEKLLQRDLFVFGLLKDELLQKDIEEQVIAERCLVYWEDKLL